MSSLNIWPQYSVSITLALDLTLTALQTCLTWLISPRRSSLPLHFTLTVTRAPRDWHRPDLFTERDRVSLSRAQRDWSSPHSLETSGDAGELKRQKESIPERRRGRIGWLRERRGSRGDTRSHGVSGSKPGKQWLWHLSGVGDSQHRWIVFPSRCWGWPRLHRNVFNVIWYIHFLPSTAHVIPQSLFYWRVYTKQALTLLQFKRRVLRHWVDAGNGLAEVKTTRHAVDLATSVE